MKNTNLGGCNKENTNLCDECRGNECKKEMQKRNALTDDAIIVVFEDPNTHFNLDQNNPILGHLDRAGDSLQKARISINR